MRYIFVRFFHQRRALLAGLDPRALAAFQSGNLSAIPPEQFGQIQGALKSMPPEAKAEIMSSLPPGFATHFVASCPNIRLHST